VKRHILAAAVLSSLGASIATAQTPQRADLNAEWTRGCLAGLRDRVRSERPGVTKVETIADTLEQWAESNTTTGVRGDGQFLKGSDWIRFQFSCVYNTGSHLVEHLRHSVKAAAGAAGPLRSRASADAYTSKACSAEVERKIVRERPRSRVQIQSDAFEEWQISDGETGVAGRGQSQGPDGKWQPFTFECACNTRTRIATRADVSWVR